MKKASIRMEAPGDDRTTWAFDTPSTDGTVLNDVSRTQSRPSRLMLAVVPDVQAPPTLPPCPSLRPGGKRRLAAQTISR